MAVSGQTVCSQEGFWLILLLECFIWLYESCLIKVDFFALIKVNFRRLILRYVLGGAWVICVLI